MRASSAVSVSRPFVFRIYSDQSVSESQDNGCRINSLQGIGILLDRWKFSSAPRIPGKPFPYFRVNPATTHILPGIEISHLRRKLRTVVKLINAMIIR